ncbi:hypothetical protein FHW36_1011661 [Chitinophaga polysaccharea]|uniref:Uncharacterized protein n=1 Tax=Chitinophaga polysaccharea TaxID=1293035 RepID=A0A561Q5T7_9BACT|nr:hypothetical protein FHW36_1011661 [Chitinophaga polysaccharea]
MKKSLQRLASFANFDLPLNVGCNQLLLCIIHNKQITAIPVGTLKAHEES